MNDLPADLPPTPALALELIDFRAAEALAHLRAIDDPATLNYVRAVALADLARTALREIRGVVADSGAITEGSDADGPPPF